jgi:hypothetical protein
MKLAHALKIPISTITGGVVFFLISYSTVWFAAGVRVHPSARGLTVLACYGAVIGTIVGAALAIALSRGTADAKTPKWAACGLFFLFGALAPMVCVPFTMPLELFDFLTH